MKMISSELRQKFLDFFEKKGHKILASASLVPKDDPSVLFTTAGMQQFKRFYAVPSEAPTAKVTTCQPCVRTSDIDEVGDETHLTFFEMLGNFSFNNYFKKEAIVYAWEFLTEVLNIDKNRIHATYFEGNEIAPADKESLEILQSIDGLKKIEPQGFEDNFWSLGTENSPGGPTAEFYIDDIEVWNLVFNEYIFRGGRYEKSELRGVDTGLGLERMTAILNNQTDVFQTDLFEPIIKKIEELSNKKYESNHKAFRVVADHIRAAVFMSADDISSSNIGQGYILRRLIRRAVRYEWMLDIEVSLRPIMEIVLNIYREFYPQLTEEILNPIIDEEEIFKKTIQEGLKQASKIFSDKKPINHEEYSKIMQLDNRETVLHRVHSLPPSDEIDPELKDLGINITNKDMHEAYVSGQEAFNLFQSYGFPLELITELAQKNNLFVGITVFNEELKKHQEKSRTASAGMFKGGLTTQSEQATKYHMATHLLLAALRQVLGPDIHQRGSNITDERLRFDFSWPEKLSDEQIKKVEDMVNEKITEDLPISMEEMKLEDAQSSGIIGEFDEKYGEKVKVYTIGDSSTSSGSREFFSREICGGPHVAHTGELGHFKIIKEESSSADIRRIKAVLE